MSSRIFVFDTNVLLTDPAAMFRFMEHDVFIPMTVLEELDAAKKGVSDLARSAREVSRRLDKLIKDASAADIAAGIQLHAAISNDDSAGESSGRLILQTFGSSEAKLPAGMPGNSQDNQILAAVVILKERDPERDVTLLTNDINLRIKAQALGIHAEDYYNDKILDDQDILFAGYREIDQVPVSNVDSTSYRLCVDDDTHYSPNEGVFPADNEAPELIVKEVGDPISLVPMASFYKGGKDVWGIHARNREQNFALNLLMDDKVDFVTMLGAAGTGKTLLALAAGLTQTLDSSKYQEIIVTRETISLGEDIGFLPGTEEEKMTPWMGALIDNLEVLNSTSEAGEWGKAATMDLLHQRIKIHSMGFMRGRTFTNRFVIVDEAQNMTAKQMRAIISRAGPGTKLVCLGNIAQIDSPYLSESTSGLTYVVKKFRSWPFSGHVTLQQGERSRLAEFAAQNL
ncbi:MAG: PhoH family protein [Gammaproteobacteria bacterium]